MERIKQMQHDVEPGNNIIIDSSTSRMPNLALSVGKIFPSKANDLRGYCGWSRLLKRHDALTVVTCGLCDCANKAP